MNENRCEAAAGPAAGADLLTQRDGPVMDRAMKAGRGAAQARRLVALLFLLLAIVMAPRVQAQDTRAVRIVVGFAPGGSVDVIGRLIAAEMTKGLQRPVILENQPGANGNIAAEAVARGPADGTVMLLTFNNHPFLKALFPRLPFDPIADFRPVGLVASTPYVLVSHPSLPGADLAEVLARAKADGRTLNFADIGPGSPQHLMALRMQALSGVSMTMLHYKGGAPAQTDVLGGHADMMLSTVALAMPQVKAGKLKVLAVSTAERLPALPDVPTFEQSGLRGLISEGWYALLLPAKASPDVAQRYNEELDRVLAIPAVRGALEQMGTPPTGGPPERLDALMRSERQLWTKVIVDNGIKAD